ncbi:MAG: hypothetical protein F4Z58_12570 [Acidimicrobiaceae bacterium]|nr:hypothetical protein [Acidimicrobiaceae bacterium]MXW61455.1 hypothetical protein [Acidimicrobiaceae bacterium]MXW76843.1 hypothetical protein [Acidimicrobiaceae bacterium]MYC41806.1 hypothetical protein [Acidimicrobiaceae bacterium]MYD07829.1 hypothetical protein [Acidimicrobiaceae bacterium]
MDNEEVTRVIRRQHGIVTGKQARAAGFSARQIQYQCTTKRWLRVGPGVYRHNAVPATWKSQLLAACLVTNGVASHRSAAALHRIDGFRETVREITVPEGRWKSLDTVRVHQTRQWYTDQHIVREYIPCTDLSRTVIDIAAVARPRQVNDMVDAVMRTGRLDLPDLYAIVVRHARRGRNGCAVLRDVLDSRMPHSGVPLSKWSRLVGRLLVDAGLPEPVYEHRVLDRFGDLIAQVDLAYPEARVAIELDSIAWHLNRVSFHNDRARWNAITLERWTPLVFTWSMYIDTPEKLITAVRSSLTPNLRDKRHSL